MAANVKVELQLPLEVQEVLSDVMPVGALTGTDVTWWWRPPSS